MASLLYRIFVYSISNYLFIVYVRNRSSYTPLQIVKEAEPENNEYANREPLVFIDHRMCHIAALPLSVWNWKIPNEMVIRAKIDDVL